MSDRLITVVIPTYHRNESLALCLERLAPGVQTLSADRYAVVVTDDGRATTAKEMIATRFPWAMWLSGPQQGPAANRNHGAAAVETEFIAFTDDDCLPAPGWLNAFFNAIEPGRDVYEGKTTCLAGCRAGIEESPINLTGGVLWSCNMLVRQSLFQSLGGFDEAYPMPFFEDIDFHERVKDAGQLPQFVAAAMVDHPPRPKRLGRAAGKLWESRVLFEFKRHRRDSVRWWLPVHIFKVRLHRLPSVRLLDWPSVLWSDFIELVYVLRHVQAWERKYGAMYASP